MWTMILGFSFFLFFVSFTDAVKLNLVPNGSTKTHKDGVTHEISKYIIVPEKPYILNANDGKSENYAETYVDGEAIERKVLPIDENESKVYTLGKDLIKIHNGNIKAEKIKYNNGNSGSYRYSESHSYSDNGQNVITKDNNVNFETNNLESPLKTVKYTSYQINPGKKIYMNDLSLLKNNQEASLLNQGDLNAYKTIKTSIIQNSPVKTHNAIDYNYKPIDDVKKYDVSNLSNDNIAFRNINVDGTKEVNKLTKVDENSDGVESQPIVTEDGMLPNKIDRTESDVSSYSDLYKSSDHNKGATRNSDSIRYSTEYLNGLFSPNDEIDTELPIDDLDPKLDPNTENFDFFRNDGDFKFYNGLDYTWEPETVMKEREPDDYDEDEVDRTSDDYFYIDYDRYYNGGGKRRIPLKLKNRSKSFLYGAAPNYGNLYNPIIKNDFQAPQRFYMIPISSPYYSIITKEYPFLAIKCVPQSSVYGFRSNLDRCGQISNGKLVVPAKYMKNILSQQPKNGQHFVVYKRPNVNKFIDGYTIKNIKNINDISLTANSGNHVTDSVVYKYPEINNQNYKMNKPYNAYGNDKITKYILSKHPSNTWQSNNVGGWSGNKCNYNNMPEQYILNHHNRDIYGSEKYVRLPNVDVNNVNKNNPTIGNLFKKIHEFNLNTNVNNVNVILKAAVEQKYNLYRLKQILLKVAILNNVDTIKNVKLFYENVLNYIVFLDSSGVAKGAIDKMILTIEQQVLNMMKIADIYRQRNPHSHVNNHVKPCLYC